MMKGRSAAEFRRSLAGVILKRNESAHSLRYASTTMRSLAAWLNIVLALVGPTAVYLWHRDIVLLILAHVATDLFDIVVATRPAS